MVPSASSRMLPWAVLDVCAAKDQSARAKPVPMGVRKRKNGPSDDPLCAYTAIMDVYDMRCAEVPACLHGVGGSVHYALPTKRCPRGRRPLRLPASRACLRLVAALWMP